MKRHFVAAFTLTLCFLSSSSSFAQSPAVADAASHKVKISINPEISKPPAIYYYGPGAALGLVGHLATSGDKEPKDLLRIVMEKDNIDVVEIVRAEARSQIEHLDKFELVEADQKDAAIQIDIVLYGFNKKNAFGSTSYPVIKLSMSYQNNKGETIWKDSDMVSAYASNSDQGFSLDTYLTEPEKIKSGLTRVSQISLSGLFKSLQSKLAK